MASQSDRLNAAAASTRTSAEARAQRLYRLTQEARRRGDKEITVKVADLEALAVAAAVKHTVAAWTVVRHMDFEAHATTDTPRVLAGHSVHRHRRRLCRVGPRVAFHRVVDPMRSRHLPRPRFISEDGRKWITEGVAGALLIVFFVAAFSVASRGPDVFSGTWRVVADHFSDFHLQLETLR